MGNSAMSPFTSVGSNELLQMAKCPAVLLVVVTEVERVAVLALMEPEPDRVGIIKGAVGQQTYYYGHFGAHRAVLTSCAMGSLGRDSAILSIDQAIRELAPRCAIMVGIAFGKDESRQHPGHVLVASQIISYELQRKGKRTVHRGPKGEADGVLLDRVRNLDGWHFTLPDGGRCKCSIGPLLSGEKLVDNARFKADLFNAFPDAIGGEMEGAGLYAAASRRRMPWLVVKAICDFADGNKHDDHQSLAAHAAASLVHAVLSEQYALEGIPNPAGPSEGGPASPGAPVGANMAWGRSSTTAGNTSLAEARSGYLEAIRIASAERKSLTEILISSSSISRAVPLDAVYIEPTLQHAATAIIAMVDAAGAEVKTSKPDEHGKPLHRWLAEASDGQALFVITGEMGSGKSELMHHARRALARAALADPTAPLPVLLRARDLAAGTLDHASLAAAAARILPGQSDRLRSLLAEPSVRWIYLLDGLDEAPASLWTEILLLAKLPDFRAARVIVTSRTVVPSEPGQVSLALPRWDSGQADTFLERWGQFDAGAVQALRGSSYYQDGQGEFLANPLTISLCLAIMCRHGSMPSGRAAVFTSLTESLFQDWCKQRNNDTMGWASVAPILEQVALQHVRGRHASIAGDFLMQMLRSATPYRHMDLLAASERMFGVLVRLEDGSGCDFLFRGLAEHLAGAALLAQGDEEVMQA